MAQKRRKFQGVLNILSFNRHFYVIGLSLFLLMFIGHLFLKWPDHILWEIIVVAVIYGLIVPLVVSAYVYDFSGYYNLHWLNELANDPGKVKTVVNINAGFDETSFIIKDKFPASNVMAFDFYDAGRHTEPAIKRARKVSFAYPGTLQVASTSLPLANQSVDIVFLLSAVHEIRSHEEKIYFLKECRRICKPDGKVVMVEHLRDVANFVAFSVGFTHFFSRFVWKDAFERAGFITFHETKFTPFMSIFECTL
ncbi:MAG TPA: methyltransferase domain-containing protein [Puia sp.]|jgi:ubiquinone/menaquinone biosynthesis C-methylase UbiE|nr:methyltransferase domain-containing protein [Puia sp.]